MSKGTRSAFAARLRRALAEAGYGHSRLRELGTLFGVTGHAVRKWLREEALPRSSRAAAVAGVLGVRRAWLLDGEPPMRPLTLDADEGHGAMRRPTELASGAERGLPMQCSAEEYEIIMQYRRLPPTFQAALRKLIASVSAEMGADNKKS